MRTARGRWACSELLEITWAHLAIIWLLLQTRPPNCASANGRQKTELWFRKVTMTRQCRDGDCGFFWGQACWWVCHIPGWGTHSRERNRTKTAKWFTVLLSCILPVIFSDTRNKIMTCFGSSSCTSRYTKSGLDELGGTGTTRVQGFSKATGFSSHLKDKRDRRTDVCAPPRRVVDWLLRCLWNANFLSQFSSLFWISAQWTNTFLDSKTSREPDGWEELGKRTHTVWKRYEFLTLHLAKKLWKLEEWNHFWFVQMHAIPVVGGV